MRKVFVLLFFSYAFILYAHEGMWTLFNLKKENKNVMKELGFRFPFDKLYNECKPSLKDAIVSFGGFCSGVVVSDDGLIFTNHHCGFQAIQQHSSVEHDYLRDGFVSHIRSEELPNPELYVSFLVRTEDVTNRIMRNIDASMPEGERRMVADSLSILIQEEVSAKDSLLRGVVDSYYGGNEYYLSVYKDYTDVRLVFAPPSSIGKFGWDTDNWMWPRHTGDFSVFRVYAGKNNQPADYSPENVPFHPNYVASVSLDGYKEGSFCLTLGYPGSTERYMSSWGIKEQMETQNAAMTKVRAIKQAIWKGAMESNDSIRIKYASKYDESSNYWKNSIGENKAIERLHVIEKKQETERKLSLWLQNNPDKRGKYPDLLSQLELNYKNRFESMRAASFFAESFVNTSDLLQISLNILNFDFKTNAKEVERYTRQIYNQYNNLDLSIDKKVLIAMLREYRTEVPESYLPEVYTTIKNKYNNDYQAYADSLYAHSRFTTSQGFEPILKGDTTFHVLDDPAAVLAIDLIVKYYDILQSFSDASENIIHGERLLNLALCEMYEFRNIYPDANATMRLSAGVVSSYSPCDAVKYNYFTTTKGVLEKYQEHKKDSDFQLLPSVAKILSLRDFDKYASANGDMNVCFISNNDITGGNSGSPMFNADGKLIGLAFDGNWEAMSSDIIYEPALQRCIGVDIRYILFMIEKYGKAKELIKELKF